MSIRFGKIEKSSKIALKFLKKCTLKKHPLKKEKYFPKGLDITALAW